MNSPPASTLPAAEETGSAVVRNIVAEVLRYLPANLVPGVGYLIGVIVFTRAFAAPAYGWYLLSMAIAAPLVSLLTQWIIRPAMRFYAEYRAAGGREAYAETVGSLTAWSMGAVVVLGAIAAVPLAAGGWIQAHALLAVGVFAFLLGSVPSNILLGVVRADLRSAAYLILVVAAEVGAIGLPLVAVFAVSRDIGWLAWGQAAGIWITVPYGVMVAGIRRDAIRFQLSPAARSAAIRFFHYGLPMVIWLVGANLLAVEDRYVLQVFRGSREVALYGVNYDFVLALATALNGAIVLGFGPAVFHHWAAGRRDEVARAISRTTDLYLLLGLGFVGGMVTVGPAVESVVIGAQYRVGLEFLLPVAMGMIFFGLGLIGHRCLELGEGTRAMATSAIWAGLANLLLNLVLVPPFGYLASAWATAVSYLLYVVLIGRQSRRFVTWRIAKRGLVVAALSATAGTYVGLAMTSGLGPNPIARLIVGCLTYLLAFGLTAAICEHDMVANLLERRRLPGQA